MAESKKLPPGSLFTFLQKEFPACVDVKKSTSSLQYQGLKEVKDKSYFTWYFPDWTLQVEDHLQRTLNKTLQEICKTHNLSKTSKRILFSTHACNNSSLADRFSEEIVLAAKQIKLKYLKLPEEIIYPNNPSVGFTEREVYQKVQDYYSRWIKEKPYCDDNSFGGVLDSDSPSGIVYDKQKDMWFGERFNYC